MVGKRAGRKGLLAVNICLCLWCKMSQKTAAGDGKHTSSPLKSPDMEKQGKGKEEEEREGECS